MDRMIYVAMTGAREAMRAQTVVAHNIANVSTTGFREVRHAVDSAGRSRPGLRHAGQPRVACRTAGTPTTGTMMQTGRDLDIAIQGEGWLAVQDADGNEAYTRAGNLRINATGHARDRRRATGPRQWRADFDSALQRALHRQRRPDLDRAPGPDAGVAGAGRPASSWSIRQPATWPSPATACSAWRTAAKRPPMPTVTHRQRAARVVAT